VSERPWSSTAPPGEFRTYISAEESIKEFTLRAVILGALFGLLFGAVTVYVGLRAGLTVSASIPISVLSISILRAFGRSTILENNIVQTTGSAGESLAAGVMFTIPALIFLGFGSEFTFWRIFPLALLGGWLGVLFMVPLRRQLIVKEHGNLAFPEGTACADVLVAGERGGSFAGRVFWGLGLGGVYTFLMNTVQAWTAQPEARPSWFPGASFRAAITSEYLGVGYIIGPRVSGILFAGGIGFNLLHSVGTDQWVPAYGVSMVLCLGAVIACIRSLLLPDRIVVRPTGAIEFVAPLRKVVLMPNEIVSIRPTGGEFGFLVIRHATGKLRLLNQFDGFHEFIMQLKAANPGIDLRGI